MKAKNGHAGFYFFFSLPLIFLRERYTEMIVLKQHTHVTLHMCGNKGKVKPVFCIVGVNSSRVYCFCQSASDMLWPVIKKNLLPTEQASPL